LQKRSKLGELCQFLSLQVLLLPTVSVAATTTNVTTSFTSITVSVAATTNVTTSSITSNQRNPLESIPDSGEIPDSVGVPVIYRYRFTGKWQIFHYRFTGK
jgi:hypothetical protein